MNTYSTSAVTTKPTEHVLEAALVTLTNNGFAIVKRDELSADLTGPGMSSTRQNPLFGASKIHLNLRGQQLCLDAELGGVETMRKFLTRFPFILGLGMSLLLGVVGGVFFGSLFGVGFGVPGVQGWTWMLVAMAGVTLPLSPWLFLSPMMSRKLQTRTQHALATLVRNAIQMPGTF